MTMLLLQSMWIDRGAEAGVAVIVLCMALCLYRLVKGPHLADRAVAADTLGVALIGLLLLLTIRYRTTVLLDGALVLSLLSFAGTVAIAQFILRRNRSAPVRGER